MKRCEHCTTAPATKLFGEMALCEKCCDELKMKAIETMRAQHGKDVRVSFDSVVKDMEREDT